MNSKHSIEPIWAYSIFGWVLGTVPPSILFLTFGVIQHFRLNGSAKNADLGGLIFIVLLVVICSVAGLVTGFLMGLLQMIFWRKPWVWAVALSPVLGFVWAILTGGAGGILVFIIGAFFGAFAAIPYGVVGFTIFAGIYEPVARRRSFRIWHIGLLAGGIAVLISLVVTPLLMLLLFGRELQGR